MDFEMIDFAVRKTRNVCEFVFPGEYVVSHDGRKMLVMRGEKSVLVDPWYFAALASPRGLFNEIFHQLH